MVTLLTQGEGAYTANILKNFTKQHLVVNYCISHTSQKKAHDQHYLKNVITLYMNTHLQEYLNFPFGIFKHDAQNIPSTDTELDFVLTHIQRWHLH